jgi:hypothetical protein
MFPWCDFAPCTSGGADSLYAGLGGFTHSGTHFEWLSTHLHYRLREHVVPALLEPEPLGGCAEMVDKEISTGQFATARRRTMEGNRVQNAERDMGYPSRSTKSCKMSYIHILWCCSGVSIHGGRILPLRGDRHGLLTCAQGPIGGGIRSFRHPPVSIRGERRGDAGRISPRR